MKEICGRTLLAVPEMRQAMVPVGYNQMKQKQVFVPALHGHSAWLILQENVTVKSKAKATYSYLPQPRQ